MKRLFIRISASAIFILSAIIGKAYDLTGHRTIVAIATHHLSASARKKLNKIIDLRILPIESTWADFIKSDPSYNYAYNWHFTNIEEDVDTSVLETIYKTKLAENNNLIHNIDSLYQHLKQQPTDVESLKFLIHLAGDYHQPLHFGKSSDKGGNTVAIQWFKDSINLHSLWDAYLIDFSKLSYTEYAGYLEIKYKNQEAVFGNKTMYQSFREAYVIRRAIYSYDYTKLNPYKYQFRFKESLDYMIFSGGMQLANMLNDIYGK